MHVIPLGHYTVSFRVGMRLNFTDSLRLYNDVVRLDNDDDR